MGRPQDIAAGAIVQLAGTLDKNRILRAKQVVILTGYVRLCKERGDRAMNDYLADGIQRMGRG